MFLSKHFPIELHFSDKDLQDLNLDTTLPIVNRPSYQISPGSFATGPNRIYVPSTNQNHGISKMLVYDYGEVNLGKRYKNPLEKEGDFFLNLIDSSIDIFDDLDDDALEILNNPQNKWKIVIRLETGQGTYTFSGSFDADSKSIPINHFSGSINLGSSDGEEVNLALTRIGERQYDEEFRLPFTEGIIYGGATYYDGNLWVVSDEQIENEIIGCIEKYNLSGEKESGIGLPWVWDHKLFEPLGLTIEESNFYVLTKRTGWFQNQKLNNDYYIERYNSSGDYQDNYRLSDENANPIGLTDDSSRNNIESNLIYIGDLTDNKLYSYDDLISGQDDDIGLETESEKIHGIGYNGASFGILRYRNPDNDIRPEIFIYGSGNLIPYEDIEVIPEDDDIQSLVRRRRKQFKSPKYSTTFSIIRFGSDLLGFERVESNTKGKEVYSEEKMFYSADVSFLDSMDSESLLDDRSKRYVTFIPEYTLVGLKVEDVITFPFEGSELPSLKFKITGFKEAANGYVQTILAEDIS